MRDRQQLKQCGGAIRCWRIAVGAIALVSWFAFAPPSATAQTVGGKFTHEFTLAGKQVPLPNGEWTLAGLGTQPFDMPALGAYGTIQTAVLLLTRGDHVDAVLEVNTNTIPVNDGWGRTKDCADAQQFMVINHYKTGWETSCAFVLPTRFDANSAGPPAWEQARGFARQAKLGMPDVWLTAGFRVSDRQDLIDARYHFDPALTIGASATELSHLADWAPDAVKADPVRNGAVQVIAAWTTGFGIWLERGLHNQVGDKTMAMPEAAAFRMSSPFVDTKLLALDRLYSDGKINWSDYLEQSRKATSEVPIYKPQVSLLSNSFEKNLSFRFFGTFVDYAIAYVVTANNFVSTGIALTINTTDSFWFVLNDQYWDDYYAKLNTHDSERIVDFTYIGRGVKA
jgi:uncharacterized membrane protein